MARNEKYNAKFSLETPFGLDECKMDLELQENNQFSLQISLVEGHFLRVSGKRKINNQLNRWNCCIESSEFLPRPQMSAKRALPHIHGKEFVLTPVEDNFNNVNNYIISFDEDKNLIPSCTLVLQSE